MEECINEFKEIKELAAGAKPLKTAGKKNPDTDQAKAQQYLEGCREGRKKAEFLENQIKELEAISEYSSPSFTSAGGSSGNSDKVGTMAAKIADMKRALEQEKIKCLEERAKALILICQIPDCRLAEVLIQRYIKDKSWCVISGEMHIAETWLYKLHTKALKAFWEMYGSSIEKNENLI